MRNELLRLPGWSSSLRGRFAGQPAFEHDGSGSVLVTIPDLHLYHDNLDEEARTQLGLSASEPECVVFLSKHRAESGTRSLTVHPLGNFGPADLGGRPATLVPAAPEAMTDTLRSLVARARGTSHRVTFEATHHGPFLSTPAFFYELGSGPEDWKDEAAARLLAEVILGVHSTRMPVGIGIGGWHYVPRLTDVALDRRVAFGHLVPSHAVPLLDDAMLDRIVRDTPRASFAYLHRKALDRTEVKRLESSLTARGLRVLREGDLPGSGSAQSSFASP